MCLFYDPQTKSGLQFVGGSNGSLERFAYVGEHEPSQPRGLGKPAESQRDLDGGSSEEI
jgi:hypothetical protein